MLEPIIAPRGSSEDQRQRAIAEARALLPEGVKSVPAYKGKPGNPWDFQPAMCDGVEVDMAWLRWES